jgi:Skp family chaperone for outer membrane proteins
LKKTLGLLSGLLLLVAWGCNAPAPEPQKFGVVDVAKVINSSQASQKANAEIEALVRGKQVELNKKGEALKALEKSVKEPGSKVKPDEYNKALAEYQRLAGAAETEVKNKAGDLRKSVLDQVKKIIEGIGKDEKFVMIFISDTVAYYQPETEINDKVIKKYDESAGVAAAPATAPPAPAKAPPITVTPVPPGTVPPAPPASK